MLKSKATATWTGSFKRGAGTMQPATAAEIPFSAGSVGLEQGGATPKAIRTSAEVTLEKRDDGFTITHIHLDTEVEADGIEEDAFQEVAKKTKISCPVSKALAAVETITLDARLRTA